MTLLEEAPRAVPQAQDVEDEAPARHAAAHAGPRPQPPSHDAGIVWEQEQWRRRSRVS